MIPDDINRTIATINTSTERMTQFLQIMRRFSTLRKEDILDLITVGVWDAREKDRLLAKVAACENPHAELSNLDLAIRSAIASSFHIAESMGGATGIGSMVFKPELFYDDWELYNPDLLLRNLREGNFARCSGPLGAGKTNLSCVAAERQLNRKQVVLSNVYMKGLPNNYLFIKDAREFFTAIGETKKSWIFFYDEAGLKMNKKDAMSLHARYFEKVMRVTRKLRGNMFFIEQRAQSMPTLIQEWSTSSFYAIEPKMVHIELKSDSTFPGFNRTVVRFPKTVLPFDTYDIAAFEMNVNVEAMFQLMSGTDNPMEVMLSFLDEPESDPSKRSKINLDKLKKEIMGDS